MQIKILKQVEINNCPVIIRQVGKEMFEYLLIFNGKFYGTFIINNLKWWELKRFKKEPCTEKEIKAMIHFLEKAAETTICTLIEKEKGKFNK